MNRAQDARTSPRYPIRLAAEVVGPGGRCSGVTRNVSTGGLCVEVDTPFPEDSQLEVNLMVVEDDVEREGGRTLGFRATVQWMAEGDRGYQIGVKFIDVDPAKVKMLENALRAVTPEE